MTTQNTVARITKIDSSKDGERQGGNLGDGKWHREKKQTIPISPGKGDWQMLKKEL